MEDRECSVSQYRSTTRLKAVQRKDKGRGTLTTLSLYRMTWLLFGGIGDVVSPGWMMARSHPSFGLAPPLALRQQARRTTEAK